ncbi:hypothetical protein BGX28_003789 [Mortierella sp. GBA30]|nr:hypothetical protein BGX28_003789 [Mortierella sp. GBA30]
MSNSVPMVSDACETYSRNIDDDSGEKYSKSCIMTNIREVKSHIFETSKLMDMLNAAVEKEKEEAILFSNAARDAALIHIATSDSQLFSMTEKLEQTTCQLFEAWARIQSMQKSLSFMTAEKCQTDLLNGELTKKVQAMEDAVAELDWIKKNGGSSSSLNETTSNRGKGRGRERGKGRKSKDKEDNEDIPESVRVL